nr:MAG TPA: hypothetical protein [Caudoviricetes sp.]
MLVVHCRCYLVGEVLAGGFAPRSGQAPLG